MRRVLRCFWSSAVFMSISLPSLAADLPASNTGVEVSLWGIGRTGVMCYMEPCPWQGIFPISRTGERGFPLSRQNQPAPRFTSEDPKVAEAVANAYSEGGCFIVEARAVGNSLDITRIVDDC